MLGRIFLMPKAVKMCFWALMGKFSPKMLNFRHTAFAQGKLSTLKGTWWTKLQFAKNPANASRKNFEGKMIFAGHNLSLSELKNCPLATALRIASASVNVSLSILYNTISNIAAP